jgi:hypothetical protein
MAFNTTSFFAGVGTAFAAITLGFAGGAMITISPKMEPNRLERVAASAPVITPVAAAKIEAPATPSVPAAKTETAETTASPDRVISLTPAPSRDRAQYSRLSRAIQSPCANIITLDLNRPIRSLLSCSARMIGALKGTLPNSVAFMSHVWIQIIIGRCFIIDSNQPCSR